MNAATFTDSELREKLVERSIDVGIIDDSTRPRYQKRLQKLLDEEPVQSNSVGRSPATRRTTATRRKSARSQQQQQQQRSPGRQVASFSSDEADLSQPEDKPAAKAARAARVSAGRRTTAAAATPASPTTTTTTTTTRRSAGRARRSAAMNTSASLLLQQSADETARAGQRDDEDEEGVDDDDDDEEEEEYGEKGRESVPTMAATRRRRTQQQQQQQQQSRRQTALQQQAVDRLQVSDTEEPPATNGHRQQQQQQQQQVLKKKGNSVANGSRPQQQQQQKQQQQQSCGQLANLSALVPNLMLAAALLLSLGIAGLYTWQQGRQAAARQLREFEEIMCTGDSADCRTQLQTWIKLARPLYDLLAAQRGDYECGVGAARDSKMSRQVASSALSESVSGIRVDESAVAGVIRLSLRAPQLGILALNGNGERATEESECKYLLAADGKRSLRCRAARLSAALLGSAVRLATTCLYALLAAAALLGAAAALRRLWLRRRRRLAAVADAAEQVLLCLADAAGRDGLPVAEVQAELQRLGHLDTVTWLQVQRHIVAKEARVVTDEVLGLGEVWRLKPGVAESLRQQQRGAAGWQGSVLPDSSLPTPPVHPPTQCLKIRGMWSPDNGHCDKERIVAELRRRVPPDSLLHVDLLGRAGEGFVYALCRSRRLAGQAWASVHANYFDGHLVTVKYMTLEKYCHRFPEKQKEFLAAVGQQAE